MQCVQKKRHDSSTSLIISLYHVFVPRSKNCQHQSSFTPSWEQLWTWTWNGQKRRKLGHLFVARRIRNGSLGGFQRLTRNGVGINHAVRSHLNRLLVIATLMEKAEPSKTTKQMILLMLTQSLCLHHDFEASFHEHQAPWRFGSVTSNNGTSTLALSQRCLLKSRLAAGFISTSNWSCKACAKIDHSWFA